MMWCDIDAYDWLNKFCGFYMATIIGNISGQDVSMHIRRKNQPNKSKLVLYKPLIHCNNNLKQL